MLKLEEKTQTPIIFICATINVHRLNYIKIGRHIERIRCSLIFVGLVREIVRSKDDGSVQNRRVDDSITVIEIV